MDNRTKVALVTGAGAGIGLATALAFGKQGVTVILVDSSPKNGQEAVKKMDSLGYTSQLIVVDVQNSGQVQKAIREVENRWGRLDILVNNAGIYVQASALETSEAQWDQVLGVNLTGAFLLTKYAVPLMVKNGGGVIINVASEAGLVGIKGQVAYNVSKAGVIGLTKSCAVDFASIGVRVNCVCPGTTYTPLVEAAIHRTSDPAKARRDLESIRPLDRLGRPEEIASAIEYLASEGAGYATGSILSIDGGYTAQ